MGGIFPFTTTVVYKKGATISEIIQEAAQGDPNLVPLAVNEGPNPSLSLVFKYEGTTVAYMIVDDHMTIDTLVHEAIHVTCRLFEIINSEVNDDTEEFFAYLNTYIFREVYKVLTTKFKLKPQMIYSEEE